MNLKFSPGCQEERGKWFTTRTDKSRVLLMSCTVKNTLEDIHKINRSDLTIKYPKEIRDDDHVSKLIDLQIQADGLIMALENYFDTKNLPDN